MGSPSGRFPVYFFLLSMESPPTPETFPVDQAWEPLPGRFWREAEAAHFCRRTGFSATPEAVREAQRHSIGSCIEQRFARATGMEKPEALKTYEAEAHERYRHIYREVDDETERRRLRRELRREDNRNFRDFGMRWYRHARQPENSAQEKFVCFLQDVFVVERQKVRETPTLFDLQQTLRAGIGGSYPELCKKVSREPAMLRYLDLDRSTARKPNENFARELFELFILGEGHYTERDIKEAARALTGYRVIDRFEQGHQPSLHDGGRKTLFGRTGHWDGDDVIDIAFRQPAARTFFVRELLKFYLSDELPVDERYIEALGRAWKRNDFSIRYLIDTVFQSRLFFHPAYRGTRIKSPVHFYLGLCQDLRLDVIPFESRLLRSMDAMGQTFFNPPNVRGWLYGKHWINSTTISARRQLVDYLFTPLDEARLNGNEQRALEAARQEGRAYFLVSEARLLQLAEAGANDLADHFTRYFISGPSRHHYRPVLRDILGPASGEDRPTRLRNAVVALLQSPAYNLC